jgi:hypothetical protein
VPVETDRRLIAVPPQLYELALLVYNAATPAEPPLRLTASRGQTVAMLVQYACACMHRDPRQSMLFNYVGHQRGQALRASHTLDEAALVDGFELILDRKSCVARVVFLARVADVVQTAGCAV